MPDWGLQALLCVLEADSSLFLPGQLRERLIALDDLDAGFGGWEFRGFHEMCLFTTCISVRRHSGYARSRKLQTLPVCAL